MPVPVPAPIPITIVTGFLGSGKTTLILNLLGQLAKQQTTYKIALVKNEFGDVAIDSQLMTTQAISGVRELLHGCICCNLVGALGSALQELSDSVQPDRIVVETSGSAFPATLAIEVKRVGRTSGGRFVLDGVVSVIDVENWTGYNDTSYTARVQARYTDLVVFNKWEAAGERRFDECLDRLGDLEVPLAWVKSDRGSVPVDLVFGIDGGLARDLEDKVDPGQATHDDTHSDAGHQSEVEVLSVTLTSPQPASTLDTSRLLRLLQTAPKDEVYRIKAILNASAPIPPSEPISDTSSESVSASRPSRFILNWAFGRWTCTPMASIDVAATPVLRMTLILARGEAKKWKKRLETGAFIAVQNEHVGELTVERLG